MTGFIQQYLYKRLSVDQAILRKTPTETTPSAEGLPRAAGGNRHAVVNKPPVGRGVIEAVIETIETIKVIENATMCSIEADRGGPSPTLCRERMIFR